MSHREEQVTPPPRFGKFMELGRDIKLSHSVFALPFALLATFMAAAYALPAGRGGIDNSLAFDGSLPSWKALLLILVCMIAARTTAMAVNRLVDARFDAANPRTARRALPAGRLSRNDVWATIIVASAVFVAATAGFWWLNDNPFPLILSPLVLVWLGLYSFTKRFTWLCHIFLGTALAMSPVAAAIAIQPVFVLKPDVWCLALMVMCWVAGFDIIYALQDVAFDRQVGLHSMPANLGVETALWVARLLHIVAVLALVALVIISPTLDLGFALGIALVTGLLILEHALVWRSATHHINMAFFTVNGIISIVLGTLGIIDVVTHLR